MAAVLARIVIAEIPATAKGRRGRAMCMSPPFFSRADQGAGGLAAICCW